MRKRIFLAQAQHVLTRMKNTSGEARRTFFKEWEKYVRNGMSTQERVLYILYGEKGLHPNEVELIRMREEE